MDSEESSVGCHLSGTIPNSKSEHGKKCKDDAYLSYLKLDLLQINIESFQQQDGKFLEK